MEYKYYKQGQESNPYLEITETQGAHAMRFNIVAVEFWFFEFHWANGWSKFCKLEEKAPDLYFEQFKEPQKEFANIDDALEAFFNYKHGSNYPFLNNSCKRWRSYLYEHGMEERFYTPLHTIIPTESLPAYLHWYKGESQNPHIYTNSPKRFWWDFESVWFAETEQPTQEAFEEHLHSWFSRCNDTPWDAIPKKEQQKHIAAYKAGRRY